MRNELSLCYALANREVIMSIQKLIAKDNNAPVIIIQVENLYVNKKTLEVDPIFTPIQELLLRGMSILTPILLVVRFILKYNLLG